jgi:hypothetical protein
MSKNSPSLAKVTLRKGESIENLLKRFTRTLKRTETDELIRERGPDRRFKTKREIQMEKRKKARKRRKAESKRRANRNNSHKFSKK